MKMLRITTQPDPTDTRSTMVATLTARAKVMKRRRITTQPDPTDTRSTMVATPEAQAKVAMEKKPLRTTTPQGPTEADF
jgi:hypothetical protein